MKRPSAEKYIGRDTLSVAEAMQIIDRNVGGIVILVGEDGTLTGTLTDGDIRRFLLHAP